MKEAFDEIDEEYKSYKMKIEKIKEIKGLGEDLYAVEAKISLKA